MNKSRINNLEKKMIEGTRKHREVKVVQKDNGLYTTRDGSPLTKDKDGSLLFEDGTIHYDANEPNPYNEIGLITREFISVKQEATKDETDGK
jgi:hypothetical protein